MEKKTTSKKNPTSRTSASGRYVKKSKATTVADKQLKKAWDKSYANRNQSKAS